MSAPRWIKLPNLVFRRGNGSFSCEYLNINNLLSLYLSGSTLHIVLTGSQLLSDTHNTNLSLDSRITNQQIQESLNWFIKHPECKVWDIKEFEQRQLEKLQESE